MRGGRLARTGAVVAVVAAACVLAVVALLPSRGTASAAPKKSGPPPLVRVMPLGDSITWGQGSATESSYRAPLWRMVAGQKRYAIRFVGSEHNGDLPEPDNEGHRRYTIGQVMANIDRWTAAGRPDVVLLHIGINDLNRRVDPDHAPERLAALVDRIYADRPGVSVVYLGLIPTTPGLQPQIAGFNVLARHLAAVERERGRMFRYVDPPALTAAERVDRLHPNDAGYLRIARALFPALTAAVEEREARGAVARAGAGVTGPSDGPAPATPPTGPGSPSPTPPTAVTPA
ncbi:SGNH/GDSL hydrolase family protein [Actinacidiphila acididurans]|uniref:SGNH hydrolase-type esterase domain-containing protein n=1 Tax=Actinacidiphila acididurans TaxID=2784346 RepID=A0ABS2U7L8_9ACTN|nr:SGNH/GDSL hydrolase family protein [Actinacidiphila acididurans]MBM9510158.1 hypothetical protein [Actinacidiphila acididurans]